jgi:hypothetical protein
VRLIRKKGSRVNKQTVQSFRNSIPDQVSPLPGLEVPDGPLLKKWFPGIEIR